MSRWITIVLGVCVSALAHAAPAADPGAELLVLTPQDLSEAADELAQYRRSTGLRVRVERVDELAARGRLDPRRVKERIRKIRAEAGEGLRYLLLMGDAPAPGDPRDRVRIPPHILKAEFVDERWAHPEELASDCWYGMLDGDLVPELSVGRLPVDDLAEARGMVRRIVAYETSRDFGSWRKHIEVVAGTAGFGVLADTILEGTFKRYIASLIDPAYDVTVTWSNPESPYSHLPSRFPEKALERFNVGSLISAYVGHGRAHAFGTITWRGKRHPTFRLQEARRVAVERGAPVMVIIACSTGWFDHPREDCISEVLLRQPRGPVAVFSSTRISQPYADAIVGRELIANLMAPVHGRLGDAIKAVRTALARPRGAEQQLTDELAGLIMRPETLEPCRKDHLYLYNLLGDPCMVLGYPRGKGELTAPERATFGQTIRGLCTLDRTYRGRGILSLEGWRGRLLRKALPTAGLEDQALGEVMAENWKRANDRVIARKVLAVDGAGFESDLAIPAGGFPVGRYVIKLYLEDDGGSALGARQIRLD